MRLLLFFMLNEGMSVWKSGEGHSDDGTVC